MKQRNICCQIAGLLAAIGAQILMAGAAPIARSASESHVSLTQPDQRNAALQPSSVRVFLNDASSAPDQTGNTSHSIGGRQADDAEPRDHRHFEDVQHIASRGMPNELLDAVQRRPLEALGPAAEASSSTPFAVGDNLSGSKRNSLASWSGRPRSKRKLTVNTAPLPELEVDGSVALSKKQSAYRKKIWPIWDKSHEPRWKTFVETSKDMSELNSDKNHVRRKAWRRLRARKEQALSSGHAERFKRANGLVGLSSDDLKQLESADLGQARIIQQRMAARVSKMEAVKPAADSEQWETWEQDMQAEEDALAQVVDRVEKLKAARPAANKTLMRPRNFIGLTDGELGLFRSDDVFERNTLRSRLSVRIGKTQKRSAVRKPEHERNPQLNADIAWRQGIELRKYYPAKDIESQIPQVLEGAASLSTDEATKQIPASLKRIVLAKATSGPARVTMPAAGARHSDLPVNIPTSTPSTAVNQPSATRPQHDLEAASQLSTPPAEQRQAPLAGNSTLPPWLRKALEEPGLRPKSLLHLASSSGTSTAPTDVAAHQHAVGSSAQTQPARVSTQNANDAATQEQNQQTRQPAVLLDLFH